MFIRLSKLTGDDRHKDFYINTDHIITYGPVSEESNLTEMHFISGRKIMLKGSSKEITEKLRGCGVEV